MITRISPHRRAQPAPAETEDPGPTLLAPIQVSIQGFAYRVWLPDDPARIHLVSKNKTCSCGRKQCTAIQAVHDYLKDGGVRAPQPPVCPICGGKTVEAPQWLDTVNGKKGFGWRCENGGLAHWMQTKTDRIRRQLAAHPWLFAPVYDENGICVYTGVRRSEVLTFEDCQALSRGDRDESEGFPSA